MKKFGLLIFLISTISFAQTLIFVEHFNYNEGGLINLSGGTWTTHSGTTGQVNVLNTASDTAGSLRYNDIYNWYFNPSVGNRIELTETETEDVGRSFSQIYSSGTIYCSFLLKVISVPSGLGTYFIHFFQGNSGYTFGNCIFIRTQSVNTFQLGINARTTVANTVWYNTNLNLNQTYLIVSSYQFVADDSNDIASLWVNPSPLELNNIPVPVVTHTNTGGIDLTSIGRLGSRQSLSSNNGMGTLQIDEIRVSNDWNLAPLPVELTSFSASAIGSTLKLSWNTTTEVNNYGFEVERKAGSLQSTVGNYEKIGFVNGNGNSNSPKSYFYEDKNVIGGKYSYRLKQIDNDGQFEYSKVIEVDLGAPKKFELSQNYPNPFNPITTIRFNLPEAGNVKLTLFNILGQELKTLVNEFKESGVYTINFDASNLNSGMYIYKLESGSFVQTRKMTLVK